jgi:hypothetical protein
MPERVGEVVTMPTISITQHPSFYNFNIDPGKTWDADVLSIGISGQGTITYP